VRIPSRELTPDDLELIEFARQIVDADTDGEQGAHTMGAAVRGADGQMYGGINLYHFTGGPCAELVALGHARASRARELSAIVAVGNCGRGPVGPCGRDRQTSWDGHAAFMDGLVDDGFVILGGPVGDGEQALHVIEAADENEIRARLTEDPWASAGLLRIGTIEPWALWLDSRGRIQRTDQTSCV
jgi:cytidine deaminase